MIEKYDDLGKIIIVRNIQFCGKDGKIHLDHAYKNGRPCIIIDQSETNYYACPLTSKETSDTYPICIKQNKENRISYIELRHILTFQIRYINPILELTPKQYYELIRKLLNIKLENFETNNYKYIYDNILKQAEEIPKIYSLKL